jgi:argininosuccinate lyase
MTEKPWEGRFAEKTDREVEAFSSSIEIDRRLYAWDIKGSIAHSRMLAARGIITDEESAALIEGLGKIKRDIERGDFVYDDSLEDIHMHIEARLLEDVGKVALKLHTARSRNDQVALDTRLFLREASRQIIDLLSLLNQQLVDLAEVHLETVMPGYTHTQRAQPVLLAHHLMAYYEMFLRDSDRFRDGLPRIDAMPLGAAALAGTTYPIDRRQVADELEFNSLAANSMDTVADRDFIIEFLGAASICMMHFSRLSEELILWSTTEFGFVELPDAFATGSSIMPQKKNPDVPELVRGKCGSVYGALVALLTTMKGLPLTYNRDLQEDKEPLFAAVDTLKSCISIYSRMLPRLKFDTVRMRQAASEGFLNATDLADYLVAQGMPFREAHSCVGKAVRFAQEGNRELHDLTLKELKKFAPNVEQDVFEALTLEAMIDRRACEGGTAREQVRQAIRIARESLKSIEGNNT